MGDIREFRYRLPSLVSGRLRPMSFSRAAEAVGRSQSTISQQIVKLETQVGKNLLTRRKGRVLELTSEGGKLAQYARRILQLNDEAYASMSDELLTGFVRLGVPLDFFLGATSRIG